MQERASLFCCAHLLINNLAQGGQGPFRKRMKNRVDDDQVGSWPAIETSSSSFALTASLLHFLSQLTQYNQSDHPLEEGLLAVSSLGNEIEREGKPDLQAYVRRLEEEAKQLKKDKEMLETKLLHAAGELNDVKRMATERQALLDEIKNRPTSVSSPSTLAPAVTERGLQTPASTTRGIAASLAALLDDAKPDLATGMRKHDEITYNYDLMLHEPPQVVLEALLGNSLKSGIGDLRQQVVQRTSESSAVVHWKLAQDTKVSFDLVLSVEATHEVHEGQEIIKILLRTVREAEIDVKVKPFEETTSKTVALELEKGRFVLSPEKVRSGPPKQGSARFCNFSPAPHPHHHPAARPNVHDDEREGLVRRGDEQNDLEYAYDVRVCIFYRGRLHRRNKGGADKPEEGEEG